MDVLGYQSNCKGTAGVYNSCNFYSMVIYWPIKAAAGRSCAALEHIVNAGRGCR